MSKRQTYPGALTDAQWALVRPYVCRRGRSKAGHPVTVDRRAVVNAILYILRTGCQWRMLPHDFPPWGTVASQYYRWRKAGVWDRLLKAVSKAYDGDIQMIDSSSIRVHQHAANAKKKTTDPVAWVARAAG